MDQQYNDLWMKRRNEERNRIARKGFAIISFVIVGIAICLFGMAACSSKLESDAYNRVTGSHTTWWDAMWVTLRVYGQTN